MHSCSVLTVYKVYNTKIQQRKGGRWRYSLIVSSKSTTSTRQRFRNFRVDVDVITIYVVSINYTKSTKQRYNTLGMVVGVTNL